MPKKHHKPEEIVSKLRQIDVLPDIPQVVLHFRSVRPIFPRPTRHVEPNFAYWWRSGQWRWLFDRFVACLHVARRTSVVVFERCCGARGYVGTG